MSAVLRFLAQRAPRRRADRRPGSAVECGANTGAGVSAVRLAGSLALALALAACGSTKPSRFYALVPLAEAPLAGRGSAVAQPARDGLLGVGLVRIPELVDRPQFVRSLSAHERQVDEYARWAEPLSPQLTAVLAANLSALLAPTPVMAQPDRMGRDAALMLDVQVLRFEALPDGQAVLEVRWSLWSQVEGDPVAEAEGLWSSPAAPGEAEAFVAAMSRNLLAFSQEVAAAVAGR